MTRQETVDALKRAAKSIGTTSVMSYLTTVAPWVQFPVLRTIVSSIVGYVLGVAIDKTELGAFFLYIDVRTSLQGRDFADKALKNREAQRNGTPEEKLRAEKELIDSFRALVRLTN